MFRGGGGGASGAVAQRLMQDPFVGLVVVLVLVAVAWWLWRRYM
jgi:hypothetical protein